MVLTFKVVFFGIFKLKGEKRDYFEKNAIFLCPFLMKPIISFLKILFHFELISINKQILFAKKAIAENCWQLKKVMIVNIDNNPKGCKPDD